jgi:EmrB/QacA subfamily drug resistance transporter
MQPLYALFVSEHFLGRMPRPFYLGELDINNTHSRYLIPWLIAFALFMEKLDATIVSIAIPQMAKSLAENPISLKFAITSYLLSLAIFIPISGWIADKFGTKKIFIMAMSVFIVGSALSGFSNNLVTLVLARVVQGFGGALMMPVGRLILLRTFSIKELVKVTNYVAIPSLIGPALGPVIGGLIVTYLSWRWIFFINIPIGLIGIFLGLKYITDYKIPKAPTFDLSGFIFLGLGLAGLSLSFELFTKGAIPMPIELACVLASIAFLIIYFINAQKKAHPLLDLSLFKIRTFKITTLGSFVSRIGIGGVPFLLPLFFQISFGYPPLTSGLLILPLSIGMLAMKFFVRIILHWLGFKKTLVFNTLLLSLSIVQFVFISVNTPHYVIAAMLFIHGLLVSLQFTCMSTLSYVDLNPNNASKGTSIASTVQQLSMGFGVATSALVLNLLVGEKPLLPGISPAVFHKTFLIIGLSVLFSTLVFLRLHKSDGEHASKM